MILLKIRPLSIVYTNVTNDHKSQKSPYYNRPRNTNIVFSETGKFHVLVGEKGRLFYSFQLCAIIEVLNYDLSKIHNLTLKNDELTFSTEFGTYTAGSLIEIEDPLS